ncbi:hypothetical protein WICMUC_002622 [Wickerhamomyces mucosus]|uniref:Uncharacterized protein n=1 Tax=Wickerhamomyces mucosus TaxID=1378264 RepID=A0A9P8PNS7_9ASCO|nr:hypothetical protein WICMUC_002622 [Wickerhamomyces mucosus]
MLLLTKLDCLPVNMEDMVHILMVLKPSNNFFRSSFDHPSLMDSIILGFLKDLGDLSDEDSSSRFPFFLSTLLTSVIVLLLPSAFSNSFNLFSLYGSTGALKDSNGNRPLGESYSTL